MTDYLHIINQSQSEWSARFGPDLPILWPDFIVNLAPQQRNSLQELFQKVLVRWRTTKPVTYNKRRICLRSELTGREKELYEQWHDRLDTELVQQRIPEFSGRILDSVVTKFPKQHTALYYIDERGYQKTRTSDRATEVNIALAYKEQVSLYSKSCFDPFGRGHDILHETSDGRWLLFSLCKFLFHRWAQSIHLYDFLRDNLAILAQMQRSDQMKQRQRGQKRPPESH